MKNTVQPYAWGSPTALSELYGVENPDGAPMAELWMGAHPKASSRVEVQSGEVRLLDHIEENPEQTLGRRVLQKFGRTLPFLFKVLCAAEPLSIQAHPSLEQAREGFAREERDGPPGDDPQRNYRDANHKPELICAIRPFWGLRGFRPVPEIRAEFTTPELRSLDVPVSAPSGEEDLADFFANLLQLPQDVRRDLVAGALALARGRFPGYQSAGEPSLDDPFARYFWVQRIADVHPGDIGILSPLILNLFGLAPGQAVYQPAGVLHAYLSGVGVELMANSDNVLRGGMTGKHIDVDELLHVGVFRSQQTELVAPDPSPLARETESASALVYRTPFDEFELHQVSLSGGSLVVEPDAPMVVFCHAGACEISFPEERVSLRPGSSCFVEAATPSVHLRGDATLYIATVPT